MGYYIRELKKKVRVPKWKVQFITQKKEFAKDSAAKNPRRDWDIPKTRWLSLGFHGNMDIGHARSRAKQLNAQLEIKRQEERRKKIDEQLVDLEVKSTAVLPEIYKDEFEKKYIISRYGDPAWTKRNLTSWRAAQRMLLEIPLDPMHWHEESFIFYDYLRKKQFSFSYLKKILLLTNQWGQFVSRKFCQTYTKIPVPRGKERALILEAYFQKMGSRLNQSEPLTPPQLEEAKHHLKIEYYHWLYLSVWLGLRPQEVDQLKDENLVRLQNGINSVPVLWIYQTKLISIPPRYRWKLIPIVFNEQKKAIEIITGGNFRRPLTKTVRKKSGIHTTLYGGRKGFTDLMLAHKQELTHISQWMGHSSIDRTWRTYKSRRITHFTALP